MVKSFVSASCGALLLGLTAAVASAWAQAGAPKSEPPAADAPIRAAAQAFAEAFNRGDAAALAAHWLEKGDASDDTGARFQSRQAIAAEYHALFQKHPGIKMTVQVTSVQQPTATTAVEDGVTQISRKDEPLPVISRYTAFHTLEDGKWLIASVREWHVAGGSNLSQLKELEGLIGKWECKSSDATVHSEFRWSVGKHCIQRDYSVVRKGEVASSGMQIMGWDPQARQIRSWSFDSSGGSGTGLWTPTADGWRVDSHGALADGTPTASRDFVIRAPGENNVLGWRSVGRMVGQNQLPDTREVVLDRVVEKQ